VSLNWHYSTFSFDSDELPDDDDDELLDDDDDDDDDDELLDDDDDDFSIHDNSHELMPSIHVNCRELTWINVKIHEKSWL
jgi:hypothetical protein